MPKPEGNVVAITGAAGGFGSALVSEFAAGKWNVAAGYHNKIPARHGTNILALPMDVTSTHDVSQSIAAIKARFGRLDVLVNNAAIIADRLSWQLTDPQWDGVMATALTGAFHCARAVLPMMVEQGGGHIINISSLSGRAGRAGQANYAAAKAGLIGFTQSLAQEVGQHNICVNAVLPGLLDTAMTAALTASQRAALTRENALGRWNRLEEVARFIVFLTTMRDVSGQIFQLDSRPSRGV